MPIDVRAARLRFEHEQDTFHRCVVSAVLDDRQRKTDVAADAGISRPALDAWIREHQRQEQHMETLTIDRDRLLLEDESRNIIVAPGAHAVFTRRTTGSLHVLDGATAVIGGIATGDLFVSSGGRVDIGGRFEGRITANDGTIDVAEGAFIGSLVMSPDGLISPTPGTNYHVDKNTPRHRIAGVYGDYRLAP